MFVYYIVLYDGIGRFSNVTGLTECGECDIGQSQPNVGRSLCDACSIATSQNVRGQPQWYAYIALSVVCVVHVCVFLS